MSRANQHGQPVGEPVPGWAGCEPPARVVLEGRYVQLEPVAAHHVDGLYDALCRPEVDDLWTYRLEERPTSRADLAGRVTAWAARRPDVTFALVPTDSGRATGMATLMRVDATHGSIEVGSVLYGPSLQRTTAATEAIQPGGWDSPTRAGSATRWSTRAATATPTGSR